MVSLYTEEERRKLWTIQLDKNEGKITIDGVEYLENEESKHTINQAIKNNEIKNIELGYPSEKQIKATKQINYFQQPTKRNEALKIFHQQQQLF